MGETSIAWTTYSFNGWVGCTKVSPGCAHCYAEAYDERWREGRNWGPGAPREITSDANWKLPRLWNRRAEAAGERQRVFSASLADVMDVEAPPGALTRLWVLIRETPWLDWLLLTKRPERYRETLPWMQPAMVGAAMRTLGWQGELTSMPWPNVWLGTTVEDRKRAEERLPILLGLPGAVRWCSYEPALEAVDFMPWLVPERSFPGFVASEAVLRLQWIVCGGESGPKARPFDLSWARSVVAQGRQSRQAVFVKQLGAKPFDSAHPEWDLGFEHSHAGDPDEWPEELRVREFPEPRTYEDPPAPLAEDLEPCPF